MCCSDAIDYRSPSVHSEDSGYETFAFADQYIITIFLYIYDYYCRQI